MYSLRSRLRTLSEGSEGSQAGQETLALLKAANTDVNLYRIYLEESHYAGEMVGEAKKRKVIREAPGA